MLQRHRPALVLTDLKLPRGDGFGVLRAAKACDPQMPVVLLTAYGAVPDVVRAMREGALDFLAKPVDPDHLRLIVGRALAERRLATENLLLKEELGRRRGVPEIVGEHEAIRSALASLRRAATSDTTVLLDRRERHRQGAVRARAARAERAARRAVRGGELRGDPRHAARERAVRPRDAAPSPARSRGGRAASRSRTAARCSSTRSASCRCRSSPRCCARCRSRRSIGSAAPCRCRSTCGSSPPPTATCAR